MMTDKYEGAVEKLITYIDNTVVFAKEQMPDVAVEILSYGLTVNMYSAVVSGVLGVMFLIIFLCSWINDSGEPTFFTGAVMLICIVICLTSVMGVKKIELAPKLYVLEQVRWLIR